MYLVLVKEDGRHTLSGIGENINDVKNIISKNNLKKLIDTGKAYLVEGVIKVIRPETTPELLEIKKKSNKSDKFY